MHCAICEKFKALDSKGFEFGKKRMLQEDEMVEMV